MNKLLAVFGNPILHSKSPLMFNALLRDSGFYTRIRVNSGESLASAVRTLNIAGANVTAPFKEEIIPYMDNLSEEVVLIGGANTIANNNGTLTAYNTDWFGATEAIKHGGLTLKGLKVTLLGLGGAGKAVAYGLVKEGADVTLVNRTATKAQDVASQLGCKHLPIEQLQEQLEVSQLFVSAVLPSSTIEGLKYIPKNVWVFDANYHASKIAAMAKENGNPLIDASQWLLYQAVLSHKYYLGTTPDEQVMGNALKQQPTKTAKTVAVCRCQSAIKVNDSLLVVPLNEARRSIFEALPDLVIYTPELDTEEVELIYNDEIRMAYSR